ncbi:GNAT family N-acetyltransferase [Consotaella aegiceratis]|uniref:GNAT family N-acetyltransferase n=1 Tax=Consotaella aegiceratis TaxID=3097961 RepID=UPI002F41E295
MSVQLRPFTADDYARAFALWETTDGIGLSEADRPTAIASYLERNPRTSFVAIDGDRLIGTILCGHDGRRGFIYHFAVAASHRRRGIGKALLRAALLALRTEGIDKCHLTVFRSNPDGTAFWRSLHMQERTDLTLFSCLTDHPLG